PHELGGVREPPRLLLRLVVGEVADLYDRARVRALVRAMAAGAVGPGVIAGSQVDDRDRQAVRGQARLRELLDGLGGPPREDRTERWRRLEPRDGGRRNRGERGRREEENREDEERRGAPQDRAPPAPGNVSGGGPGGDGGIFRRARRIATIIAPTIAKGA